MTNKNNRSNASTSKSFIAKMAITVAEFIEKHPFLALAAILALVGLLAWLDDSCSAASLASAVIAGTDGGKHVVGGPITTDIVRKEGDFLLNEIDSRIVKIRPMATPIDQISRLAGAKHAGSMIVDYYSVDTKPTVTKVTGAVADMGSNAVSLNVKNPEIFEVSDTILVKGVSGYDSDGVTTHGDLVLYVFEKSSTGIKVLAVNGKKSGNLDSCIPAIPEGAEIVRMGRAATELDVQSPQFESLPVKSQNFCQIFKMQIEQSTFQRIANKEVDWGFSDQEEAAIYDMRLGMEKNFLFGAKRRILDPNKKEDVLFTGGIWWQAGKEYSYAKEDGLTQASLINMMKEAFTGNAGNKRKVLIGGSELIELLSNIETTKVLSAGENIVKWGIDFTEIRSKFGKFYVLLSEIFDECGMPGCGIVIEPEYIQKYSHIPFATQSLNLKDAGIRNTDALVLTEASCVTLRYPKAHMRITAY